MIDFQTEYSNITPPQANRHKMRDWSTPFIRILITATTGTKSILAQRIVSDLQTPLLRPLSDSTPHRILSIDMGIRNLALCLLHIPSASQIPEITDWDRITVSQKPDSLAPSVSESFEPIDYAAKAYMLMKYSLEKYNPHTILIERQRHRSGGGVAVQEWTVRVNMLESMFHAVLHTIAQQNQHDFMVHSVSPRKVTQLWVGGVKEKMSARETKNAKIAAAERIISGFDMKVLFSGQAKDIAEGYISASSVYKNYLRKSNQEGRKSGSVGVKKFDDLADSMLQGLGWWKWHVNRSLTMDEILQDPEEPEKWKKAAKEETTRSRQMKTKTVVNPSEAEPEETTNGKSSNDMNTKNKSQRKKALEIT